MKCVFHSDCFDGMGAALLVKLKHPECEMIPGVYNRTPPSVTPGEVIYIVDFSYPPHVIEEHFKEASLVWVMDHHDTAIQNSLAFYATRPKPKNLRLSFEYDSSGVGVVWNCLFSADEKEALINRGNNCWQACAIHSQRPIWLDHVQNRDMHRFDDPHPERYPQLSDTHAFMEAVGRVGLNIDSWLKLFKRPYLDVLHEGKILHEYQMNMIKRILDLDHSTFDYEGHAGVWINAPHQFADALASQLKDGFEIIAVYSDQREYRKVSLRSRPGGFNLRELASRFGGGGHLSSAGFEVPLDFNLPEVLSAKG